MIICMCYNSNGFLSIFTVIAGNTVADNMLPFTCKMFLRAALDNYITSDTSNHTVPLHMVSLFLLVPGTL